MRFVIAEELEPWGDGRVLEAGALYLGDEDERIPVLAMGHEGHILGKAHSLQRNDRIVSMEVEFHPTYKNECEQMLTDPNIKHFYELAFELSPFQFKKDVEPLVVESGRVRALHLTSTVIGANPGARIN